MKKMKKIFLTVSICLFFSIDLHADCYSNLESFVNMEGPASFTIDGSCPPSLLGSGGYCLCAYPISYEGTVHGCNEFCFETSPANPSGPTNGGTGGSGSSSSCGSIIRTDNQSVGEQIPIIGTPFDLVYVSDRVIGSPKYVLNVPLVGATVPSGLTGVTLSITYAGYTVTESYLPSANLNYSLTWNGVNSSSNPVQGTVPANITITYPGYTTGLNWTYTVNLGSYLAINDGLGGWTPSIQHYYDLNSTTLYYGNGEIRQVPAKLFNSGANYIEGNDDGSELYVFDLTGKHLQTLNGLTGSTIYTFAYDSQNRLSSITDAYGNVSSVVRNGSGVLTGINAPYGQSTSLSLDSNGNLSSITNPNFETYSMTYYTGGLLNTFQKPRGQVSTMTYGSTGVLTSDLNSAGNSTTLSSSVDSSGNTNITSTSNLGVATDYSLAATPVAANVTRTEIDADGLHSTFTLVPNASVATGWKDISTSVTYVSDPRLGSIANFISAQSVRDTQSTFSETSTRTIPGWTVGTIPNNPSFFDYTNIDTKSYLNTKLWDENFVLSTGTATTTSPIGRVTKKTRDTYGKITSTQLASYSAVDYDYDSNGRLDEILQGARETDIAYNSSGFISSVTNPLSEGTQYTYDGAGRVLTQTLPDTRVINYSYDLNGNLTSVTPASSNSHDFDFNSFDLMSEYLPPSLGGSAVNSIYTYNNDKKITEIQRPDGNNIVFHYNATTGYLSSITVPNGTFTYGYTTGGLITTATSPDSVTNTLTYSGTQETADTITRSGTFQSEVTTNWTANFEPYYDQVSYQTPISAYTYDSDTLLTGAGTETLSRDSATGFVDGTTLQGVVDSYTYDSAYGEEATYNVNVTPSPIPSHVPTPLFSESFTRDEMGRITAKSETELGTTTTYGYTYDSADRLTAVTENGSSYSNYSYDLNSNRTSGNLGGVSFTATFDAQDRLLTYNTLSFTYTLNGEIQSKTDSVTGNETTYTYDVMGNLKTVHLPGGEIVSYLADGFNQREARLVNGTIQTQYLYQNRTTLVGTFTSSGVLLERFIWGSKSNIPDYLIKSGVNYKMVSDERGSVRLVVNATTGAIAERMDYDEFGNVITDTSPGFQPFGFAGCLYDSDTKICRFGARDYDASTGRFISKDPLLFGGGDTNLYGYTLNDPINYIDPSGKTVAGVFGGLCMTVGGAAISAGGKPKIGIPLMVAGILDIAAQSTSVYGGVTIGSCGGGGGGPGGGFPGGSSGPGGWSGPGGGWVGGSGSPGGNSGSGGGTGGSGGANSCHE